MQYATDPHDGDLIDVEEYVLRYGHRGAGEDLRPPCVCEVCKQRMRPRGELTPNTHAHFAHQRGAWPCPTQSPAGRPYLALSPADPDPVHAAILRREFVEDWPRTLGWLRGVLPFFSPVELDRMLTVATRARLWEHRQLQAWQVPSCLLMMCDFHPKDSQLDWGTGRPKRVFYMRYWFAQRARNIGDLWIHAPTQFTVVRGSYRVDAGTRRRPGVNDLVRTVAHEVTPALRLDRVVLFNAGLAEQFAKVLKKHLP